MTMWWSLETTRRSESMSAGRFFMSLLGPHERLAAPFRTVFYFTGTSFSPMMWPMTWPLRGMGLLPLP